MKVTVVNPVLIKYQLSYHVGDVIDTEKLPKVLQDKIQDALDAGDIKRVRTSKKVSKA